MLRRLRGHFGDGFGEDFGGPEAVFLCLDSSQPQGMIPRSMCTLFSKFFHTLCPGRLLEVPKLNFSRFFRTFRYNVFNNAVTTLLLFPALFLLPFWCGGLCSAHGITKKLDLGKSWVPFGTLWEWFWRALRGSRSLLGRFWGSCVSPGRRHRHPWY